MLISNPNRMAIEPKVGSTIKLNRDYLLILIVIVMSVGANLSDDIMASIGGDRNYLLAGLLIVVAIALVRYVKFVLVMTIIILAVGANLPQELAQPLNIDPRFLMIALAAIVITSLANRVMKLPSGLEKPQGIVTEHGSIALFKAIEGRRISLVRSIVGSGANIEARSEQGLTALMMAASNGCEEVVQLLIDKGSNLNAVNAQGQTALQMARLAGHQASVDALMVAVMGSTTEIGIDFGGVIAKSSVAQ